MKNKILKILEDCCSKGYDDLHFESDRNYIANAIIENGTLRDFPCNIGDEIFWAWDLDKQYSQVMRGVVIGLSISHKNTVWFSVKYDDGLSFDHTIEDWGKSVFLTKAEAEKKLKEQQNER